MIHPSLRSSFVLEKSGPICHTISPVFLLMIARIFAFLASKIRLSGWNLSSPASYHLFSPRTVTPLEYKCDQCGESYLNLTGGICPITACSKSLVNGQCGGSKNGMCEVDNTMECGWERIYRRLEAIGRLDVLKCPTQIHNFATDDEVAK